MSALPLGATALRSAVIVGLALVGVIALPTPASAHNYYVDSTPSVNEVLTELPEQFIVTTNDNLLDLSGTGGGFFMQVQGPDGLYYGDGCVTVSGPSVETDAAVGPPGKYSLGWQVVSADGHTVSGEIPFTWQPASDSAPVTQGKTTPATCGQSSGSEVNDTPTTPDDAAAESTTDILWIGGAVVAVAIALVATLLLVRPRKKEGTPPAADTPDARYDNSPVEKPED